MKEPIAVTDERERKSGARGSSASFSWMPLSIFMEADTPKWSEGCAKRSELGFFGVFMEMGGVKMESSWVRSERAIIVIALIALRRKKPTVPPGPPLAQTTQTPATNSKQK